MIGWLLLFGCSGLESSPTDGLHTGDTAGGVAPGALRIDVTPLTSSSLLPQSTSVLPAQYANGNLPLELFPTVTLDGVVSGEVTHPWQGAPSEPEAVSAVITAAISDSLNYGVTTSNGELDGSYQLSVPQHASYRLAVVPTDASIAMQVMNLDLLESGEMDLALPVGIPIYGRLTDSAGLPVAGAPLKLYAENVPVPISSSTFYSDVNGWYLVRVASPGSWRVETVAGGESGDLLPSVAEAVEVENEDGAQVDLVLGSPVSSKVIGKVVDSEGQPVAKARVRLTSKSLVGSEGSFSAEVDTSVDGTFYAETLAGDYVVEVIPPYDSKATPYYTEENVGRNVRDLGAISLLPSSLLSGTVIDGEAGLRNVTITATQRGFDGYVYTTTSGEDGRYLLEVPAGEYDLVLTPPDSSEMAITRNVQTTGSTPIFSLEAGLTIAGTVSFAGEGLSSCLLEVRDAASGALLARTLSGEEGSFLVRVVVPQTPDTQDSGTISDTGSDTGS